MPGTNNYLQFATDGGATVVSQATYAALGARGTGFQNGVAEPTELNKVWRQGAFMAHVLGRFIAEVGNLDALDDADADQLLANLVASLNTGVAGVPRGSTIYSTAGAHNFTVPDNVYRIKIRLVGGGAGGGGNTTSGGGGGGGAGGYLEKILAVTPGDVLAFVVGAAGAGGSNAGPTAADNNGVDGTATTLVSAGLSAAGGVGGGGAIAAGQGISGAGGLATGGDLNTQGGDGNAGFWPGATSGVGGMGGTSVLGGGGAASSGSPNPGRVYGGGGAGGGTNFGGAAGAVGVAIIEY